MEQLLVRNPRWLDPIQMENTCMDFFASSFGDLIFYALRLSLAGRKSLKQPGPLK